MKRFIGSIIACLLALGVAACAAGATPTPAPTVTPQPYTSAFGGFTVLVPAPLTESTEIASSEIGNLEVHTFAATAANWSYQVVYVDYPTGFKTKTAREMLDSAREAQLKVVNGTLVSAGPITLSGYTGEEIRIRIPSADGPEQMLRGRLFWVGTRMYRVLLFTPVAQADNPGISSFLDSFQLRDIAQ